MSAADQHDNQRGLRAGIAAYTIWGLLTIYWKQLKDFDAVELIGWRVAMAALMMAIVVAAGRSWTGIIAALRRGRSAAWIVLAAVLLTGNWGSYVYAVVNDQVIETALGYFIAPLGTMAVGVLVLGERPSNVQKFAAALTLAAVVELSISYGRVPLVSLVIAVSWTFYGLCKRNIPLSGVDGFAAESFVLAIPAAAIVVVFAGRSDSIPSSATSGQIALVALAGIATAVPLIMFAYSAVRVPFTILGPVQFLVPIINLLLGWAVYDESLPWDRVLGFALVWIALALVTLDRFRTSAAAKPATQPAPVGSARA